MLEDASAYMIIFHLGFVYVTSSPQILNTCKVTDIMLDIRDKDEYDTTTFPKSITP